MKKPLLIIAGPTACGKTDVSVNLARLLDGEIISADSMQIYRFMDIGTAKITPDEMQGVPHHLIGEINPDEPYSAAVFSEMASERIKEICSRGRLPILVGGTGFYINALLRGNTFTNEPDTELRKNLAEQAEKFGNEFMHRRLRQIDPEYAETLHPNNSKRVIRAIEFFEQTGRLFSENNRLEKQREASFNHLMMVLHTRRELIYERINRRVDRMIEQGLVEEVKELMKMGYSPGLVSMQGIGYKEIIGFLNGGTAFETAVSLIKQNTRHFAKRQLTWFSNQNEEGVWFDVEHGTGDLLKRILTFVQKQDIINEHR